MLIPDVSQLSGLQGLLVSSELWFDLARQDIQPLFQRRCCTTVQLTALQDGNGREAVKASIFVLEASICNGAAFEEGQILRISGEVFVESKGFRSGEGPSKSNFYDSTSLPSD